jgi:hypothetical protein
MWKENERKERGYLKMAKEKLTAKKILAIVVLTVAATVFAYALYFGLVLTTTFLFPNSSISWMVIILYPCALCVAAIVCVVLRLERREAVYTLINLLGVILICEGVSFAIARASGTRWLFFLSLIGGAIMLISFHLYRKDLQKKKSVNSM